ncbi:MAG: type II secretion system F family protein, partial [Pseudomonadota bacterium]
LLATGERSGELVTALERGADHLEQDARIRLQLFNSLVYPTVIVAIALAIFAGLTIFVVPKFADALQKAGHVEIPFGAQLMLDLSQWIDRFGIHALTVTAVVLVVVFAGYRLGLIKNFVDRLVFKIPFVGTNILNASMAHMGWTMSVLLQSGQSLLESLEFLARNTGNRVISDSFRKARDEILEGNNLAHSLDQPEIPLLVRNMCVVGERSGQLESAVRGLGEHFQRESSRRLKTTIAVMEPVMTLSVAGLVAFIYISFFKALMLVNTAI